MGLYSSAFHVDPKRERIGHVITMTSKIFLEKADGGYIVAEANPDPKNTTDLWINKSVFFDFPSCMEEIRRRLGVSDVIASKEGRLSY